MRAAINHS